MEQRGWGLAGLAKPQPVDVYRTSQHMAPAMHNRARHVWHKLAELCKLNQASTWDLARQLPTGMLRAKGGDAPFRKSARRCCCWRPPPGGGLLLAGRECMMTLSTPRMVFVFPVPAGQDNTCQTVSDVQRVLSDQHGLGWSAAA